MKLLPWVYNNIQPKYYIIKKQFNNYYEVSDHRQERNDADYIIHRTATTIFAAQKAADYGHHYYGLGQAVAHQQKARELYWDGSYREAIYHSLRARDLAFQVIVANRERPRREYYRDEMEDRYNQTAPKGKQLDIGIDTVKIGIDDAVVKLHFGLDINQ
jgi:hypothetical protein